jgi:2-polyprenyl-6-methoxyphenol hydroxylase-like FAD-dependent oxidoreductase
MSPQADLAHCEQVFARDLDGHPILSNNSYWRQFPAVWNERWSFDNVVLMGDALRTAHFSIGSGTRLAMEDAVALFKALREEPTVALALGPLPGDATAADEEDLGRRQRQPALVRADGPSTWRCTRSTSLTAT